MQAYDKESLRGIVKRCFDIQRNTVPFAQKDSVYIDALVNEFEEKIEFAVKKLSHEK